MKWRAPGDRRVIEAVVESFRDPAESSRQRLRGLKQRDWERTYHWLDASGLALYFLHQLETLGIEDAVPAATLARLRRNRADHKIRSSAMFAEFAAINEAFLRAGIHYCNLKGFTLSPDFCPDPALRHQLDLDFLVDGRSLGLCRELLSKTGYVLTIATAQEWQFEAGASDMARIEDHYRPKPQRSVELHFTCNDDAPHEPTRDYRLDRLDLRSWNDLRFPVLSPGDQFVAQALHLLSHLRSACTRPSWLLEYKRRVSARHDDWSFWEDVRQSSLAQPDAPIAIGLATLLSSQLFGGAAPAQLNGWTLDRLPAPVRLWADLYGRKAVLAHGPGTKLYLLLERELAREETSWRTQRKNLLPLYCATRLCLAGPSESLSKRFLRQYYQARFVLFRFRFHVVEGIRYAVEAWRWKRHRLSARQHAQEGLPASTRLNKV